jgi:hypothetical protein
MRFLSIKYKGIKVKKLVTELLLKTGRFFKFFVKGSLISGLFLTSMVKRLDFYYTLKLNAHEKIVFTLLGIGVFCRFGISTAHRQRKSNR